MSERIPNVARPYGSRRRVRLLIQSRSPTGHLSPPHQSLVTDQIHYGFHPSPFGECLIGITANTVDPAVCFLAFIEANQHAASLASLRRMWPGAKIESSQSKTATLAKLAFSPPKPEPREPHTALRLLARGTAFQLRVWRSLLDIPFASTSTYGTIAHSIGARHSSRAVGAAASANPIAWLIPCHRVVRADGTLGGYRWGHARKAACLEWESRFALRRPP